MNELGSQFTVLIRNLFLCILSEIKVLNSKTKSDNLPLSTQLRVLYRRFKSDVSRNNVCLQEAWSFDFTPVNMPYSQLAEVI